MQDIINIPAHYVTVDDNMYEWYDNNKSLSLKSANVTIE